MPGKPVIASAEAHAQTPATAAFTVNTTVAALGKLLKKSPVEGSLPAQVGSVVSLIASMFLWVFFAAGVASMAGAARVTPSFAFVLFVIALLAVSATFTVFACVRANGRSKMRKVHRGIKGKGGDPVRIDYNLDGFGVRFRYCGVEESLPWRGCFVSYYLDDDVLVLRRDVRTRLVIPFIGKCGASLSGLADMLDSSGLHGRRRFSSLSAADRAKWNGCRKVEPQPRGASFWNKSRVLWVTLIVCGLIAAMRFGMAVPYCCLVVLCLLIVALFKKSLGFKYMVFLADCATLLAFPVAFMQGLLRYLCWFAVSAVFAVAWVAADSRRKKSGPKKKTLRFVVSFVVSGAVFLSATLLFCFMTPIMKLCVPFGAPRAIADGGKKLDYLWCFPNFDRGTVERRVKEGNFSVKTATYWDAEPSVKDFGANRGFEKHAQYRFMGTGKTQWLAVEYMRLDKETPVAKDIATWVKAGLMLTGKIDLVAPDGVEFRLLSMAQVPQSDNAFLAKHKADMMSSHLGTVKIGDMYHRFFIVCLNRGRESWKIVKVFPVHPPTGCTEEEACKFGGSDFMIAGLFIGNFKILSDEKLPAFPHVPAEPRNEAVQKGDALLAAIGNNDAVDVRQILESGADPNYRGCRGSTPLGVAVGEIQKDLNLEIVEMLLKHGADPKALWGTCGTTPFFSLVQNSTINRAGGVALSNQVAAVRLLLKHGADPDKEQGLFRKSVLGYAVMRAGDIELVKALVEGGATITSEMIEEAKSEKVKQYLLHHKKESR